MKKCRSKYITIESKGSNKIGICKAKLIDATGRLIECGKVYSNPSPTTLDDHLCSHIHLEEFTGKKLIQKKINFLEDNGLKNFKNLVVALVVNNNLSFNLLESKEWQFLVRQHLMRDNFGSHAAKEHLYKLYKDGKQCLEKLLPSLTAYSISEDEGTVASETKVLHNLHFVDPFDLSVKTVFLRYFSTKNKEETTLVNHWNETIIE